MSKRIRSHVRSNVVGYLALFVALSGTATAVTQLDRNSVRSIHVVNGQIKRGDIRANAVTGAKVAANSLGGDDVDEASLRDAAQCPAGFNRVGDVCYETQDRNGSWLAAYDACTNAELRLPTSVEAVLMLKQLPTPANFVSYWTETPMGGSQYAQQVVKFSDGSVVPDGADLKTQVHSYRCVTSPR